MSNELPILLAWVFLGSGLLGLVNTSRWKAVLVAVLAVSAMRITQAEIDLFRTGTHEAYAWLGFLFVATWIPVHVVSAIGVDLGKLTAGLFRSKEAEAEPAEEAEEATE